MVTPQPTGIICASLSKTELSTFCTGEALSGVMRSQGPTPSGKPCPIEFGIRVTSCPPGAIQAVVETSVPINEACQRQTAPDGGEASPTLAEFRFERVFVDAKPSP